MISTPDELDAEVIAVDLSLDAIARRGPTMADPALAALADFAHTIDAWATSLEVTRSGVGLATGSVRPARLNGQTPGPAVVATLTKASGRHARTRPTRRKALGRIATAITAAAAAVALAGALPINSSPSSPLNPLHQLFYPQDERSAADSVRLNLASARQALDEAAAGGTANPNQLDRARRLLADARAKLTQVTDPGTRSELEGELSDLEQRANRLADDQHDEHPDSGQEGQQGQDDQQQPAPDPPNESGQPSAGPHATDDGAQGR